MEALVYVVLGIAVALLTSIVKQESWSNRTKQSVSTVLSILGGIVTSYFAQNGTLELSNSVQSSAILLAVSQLVYSYGLKNTSLNSFLTSLHLESTLKTDESIEQAALAVAAEVMAEAKPAPKPRTKKATTENITN